jgi:hypothetical protein
LLEFARLQFSHGVVRQRSEGGKDFGFILAVHGDHEINVTGDARQTGSDDRKAADHDIAGAALVQFAAEGDKVGLGGRARL